jgi:membrane associated rhomboid family serine protease
MIPIKDDNPTYSVPIITILLIIANIAIFVYQFTLGQEAQAFVYRLGAIPWEITHFREHPELPMNFRSQVPNILTIFTSMFLHGGILHLLGNMLYLWIFGDNIEALMGHGRFLLFYLICGVAATLTHIITDPDSVVPMIGASGAISGVLGAYFLRFPRAKVHVLIILFIFIRVVRVSALFVLGFWFVMQVLSGFGSLGFQGGGGVAWFAHIGGFVAGMVLVFILEKKERVRIHRRAGWWW